MTDKNVSQLVINKLTQAQYEAAAAAGNISDTELYFITDTQSNIDNIVIEGSTNAVTGGAVYDAIAAIPTPDVSGQINTHNTDTFAHNDIRTAIDTLESEIDGKLSGKSDTGHTHDDRYYTEAEIDTLLNGKSDASHNHDDKYYTESEIDSKFGAGNVLATAVVS